MDVSREDCVRYSVEKQRAAETLIRMLDSSAGGSRGRVLSGSGRTVGGGKTAGKKRW